MSYETEVYLVYLPGEGFTRGVDKFTNDFAKARIFSSSAHAKNSKAYKLYENSFVVPAKVVVDPEELFLLKLRH